MNEYLKDNLILGDILEIFFDSITLTTVELNIFKTDLPDQLCTVVTRTNGM